MSVSIDVVRRVARLARLSFSEDEERKLADELGAVLDYMEQLESVELSENDPDIERETSYSRPDTAGQSISRDDALRNADHKTASYFEVPKVISKK